MTPKKKTFSFLDKINTRWDFLAWALNDKLWAVILVIIVTLLMISGFKFESGDTKFEKDPIHIEGVK